MEVPFHFELDWINESKGRCWTLLTWVTDGVITSREFWRYNPAVSLGILDFSAELKTADYSRPLQHFKFPKNWIHLNCRRSIGRGQSSREACALYVYPPGNISIGMFPFRPIQMKFNLIKLNGMIPVEFNELSRSSSIKPAIIDAKRINSACVCWLESWRSTLSCRRHRPIRSNWLKQIGRHYLSLSHPSNRKPVK